MNLTPHFTVAEFHASEYAARHGIDNTLPATLLPQAQATCQLLERIRAHLGALCGHDVPVTITSGYRCLAVNTGIGSDPSSDHVRGLAADIKAPAFGSAYQVAKALVVHVDELGIGQLIHEHGVWVHVSTRRPDKDINRVITIPRPRVTQVGIQEVLA